MSSRLSCWLHGHQWRPPGRQTYSDLFGNQWRLQRCEQCHASRRILHRAWSDERPGGA